MKVVMGTVLILFRFSFDAADLSELISETMQLMRNSPELKPSHRIETWLRPVQVKAVTGVKSLSIGLGYVAALLRDGTLRLWGHDGWGQIGVGTAGFYHEKPVKVTGISNVAAVYLGGAHSFAVRADGTLWIWGKSFIENGPGVLGKNLHVPTLLDLP